MKIQAHSVNAAFCNAPNSMEEVLAQEAMAKGHFKKAEKLWDNVIRADPKKKWTAAASARAAGYHDGADKYGMNRHAVNAMRNGYLVAALQWPKSSCDSTADERAPALLEASAECAPAKTALRRGPHGYDYL